MMHRKGRERDEKIKKTFLLSRSRLRHGRISLSKRSFVRTCGRQSEGERNGGSPPACQKKKISSDIYGKKRGEIGGVNERNGVFFLFLNWEIEGGGSSITTCINASFLPLLSDSAWEREENSSLLPPAEISLKKHSSLPKPSCLESRRGFRTRSTISFAL